MLQSLDVNAPTIVVLVIVVVLFVFAFRKAAATWSGSGGCHGGGSGGGKERRVKVADKNEANYPYSFELSVGGMTCDNCALRVENAINRLDGTWARVDRASGVATVLAKEDGRQEACADAVREAGYYIMNS